jgi:hypothetical protein
VNDPTELQQEASEQLQVPEGSILYQPFTVNINYPKYNMWSQEVIEDLHSYSADEDRQGGPQVTCTRKDALQNVIMVLPEGDGVGVSNWDENYYLGNI